MRILIVAKQFPPQIGGIQNVMLTLTKEFLRLGHKVQIITEAKGAKSFYQHKDLSVYERPGKIKMVKLAISSDVVLHSRLSLRYLWLTFLPRVRSFVIHHTWYVRQDGSKNIRDKLKSYFSKRYINVAVSEVIARVVPGSSRVIHNPYQDDIFAHTATVDRRGLIFVGRLVFDKGLDLLISTLKKLQTQGIVVSLTVVGEGPEKIKITQQIEEQGLGDQVSLLGSKMPTEIAELLRQHCILVIPSRCCESFGVVALEGLASGCEVVAADDCGLVEAIGEWGYLFKRGNLESLIEVLHLALTTENKTIQSKPGLAEHLERFRAENVAISYLNLMNA